MHIFLSYAAEDRDSAEQIYLALTSAGHQVFFDQATLPAGGDYNTRIRQALRASELLIFLISPDSVARSSYALTELNFAREKWPHPGGAVLPVMVRSTEFANIPNYLKAVTVLEPSGNATAEVAAWVASQKETSVKSSIRNIIGKRTLIGTSMFVVVIAIIFFTALYVLLSDSTLFQKNADILQNILVWKVGSPHEGDTPDTTPPFELQRESKKMGFQLSVKGFPAKGFAAKFFEAVEKHEEPDILVIDNYGIIEGITTALGSFTGIGTNRIIEDSLIFVTGSLKEFASSGGGWQILISTSRNYQKAKALALRQPHCDPELKTTLEGINKIIADELHKYALKYIFESDIFHARLGSDFRITICGFWGNKNIAFLNSIVAYEAEKKIGWGYILVIMEEKDSSWELVNLGGGNVDLIKELNKKVKLIDTSSDTALQNNLKIIGPPDGTESTRTSRPSLEWEWSGDVKSIACYLIEFQYGSGGEWFKSYFKLILPQKNVKLIAPFGVGAQPHRWKVWAIDKKGSMVRSSWSTINYSN